MSKTACKLPLFASSNGSNKLESANPMPASCSSCAAYRSSSAELELDRAGAEHE
eukprot:CAMPEP_0179151352 /NCGR_PEP_ID=MMETSP0796-20121207/73474_1 /TAXON_ID=73915 /ORGANISM="Pyrodinium bahamense, Strain pbaha01" /LENGTH=53 /DNA_ID=CAMNT_0020852437 /DNA_START=54 /DNA_END=212 /DNA_ORIENTATION=-